MAIENDAPNEDVDCRMLAEFESIAVSDETHKHRVQGRRTGNLRIWAGKEELVATVRGRQRLHRVSVCVQSSWTAFKILPKPKITT